MKKYLILIVCLFISALSFNILQYPNNIVSGGIPGVAIIINNFIKISPSTIIFGISILLFIISFIFLGKKKTISSIVSTFLYPIFIKLTSNLNISITLNKMIITVLIGIITGLSVGLIYRNSLNNGGISILVETISKYTKISIPITSFILNIIIILLGFFLIGNDSLIYSTIILVINTLMIKIIIPPIPNKKSML